MIKKTPISKCFPDYKGSNEFEESAKFIEQEYCKRVNRPIVVHHISARFKKDVKWCWDEVKQAIIENNKDNIEAAKKRLGKDKK